MSEANSVKANELKHKGFGRYEVVGTDKVFESKADAEAYVRELNEELEFQNAYGDVLPEGIEIRDHTLMYRGSVMELPMNEVYTPTGEYNTYYDRAWVWGWASHTGTDIASKQARGFRLVGYEELEKEVKEGKVPSHYLGLLRAEGSLLVYGDSVLMRMPRVLWRQKQAEREKRALAFVKRTDDVQRAQLESTGMKLVDGPIQNELKSDLKIVGI
jgi:hypothetical protein